MKNWMISEHCRFFWLLRKHLVFILNYFSQLLFHVTGSLAWLLKSTSFELFRNYFLLLAFALSFPYLTQFSALTLMVQHLWDAMLCQWSSDAGRQRASSGGYFPEHIQALRNCVCLC